MSDNNGKSNFDVQAWRESRLHTYTLEFGGEIQYRIVDVLALLDDEGNTPNPLLAIVAENTDPTPDNKKKKTPEAKITPETLQVLRKELDRVMCEVVVYPPLLEQGHKDGVSLSEFSQEEKQDFFTQLMGGERQLDTAEKFREKPPGGLVTAQDGETIRNEAV